MAEFSKTALVTGCSSGIGRATAVRLAKGGCWTVWASGRRMEDLSAAQAAGCRAIQLDVTDEASMRTALERIEAETGPPGALVNNAGYSQSGAVEEVPLDDARQQFETNVFGLIRLTQLVLPAMRERCSGRIVNLGSMGGRLTFPGGGIYHATKYALEAISDALRFEVRGFGVDVALVQPGLIRTEFSRTATAGMPEAPDDSPYAELNAGVVRVTRSAYTDGLMAKLGGEPDDVARVIERALNARKPKARYPVTASARLLMAQRALLPDGVWDRFLAANYPQPGSCGQKAP